MLEGLRGEDSIAELCRREGINQNLYYRWSKEFLEAGKKRLAGDTAREASSDEVKALRHEVLTRQSQWRGSYDRPVFSGPPCLPSMGRRSAGGADAPVAPEGLKRLRRKDWAGSSK